MWLVTKFGFFSVVQKAHDRQADSVTIRARVRSDLDALRDYLPQLGLIAANQGTDYAYRAQVGRSDFAAAMSAIALDIDYSNFKDKVAEVQGKIRAKCYADIWNMLYKLQSNEHIDHLPSHSNLERLSCASPDVTSYGGILVDVGGQVLLRSPADHFDGYVWTFAKGKVDPNESPEQTALREVREETGIQAEIVSKLPGAFQGGTGLTEYFLMRPHGTPGKFDESETAEVRWVNFDEAKGLISLSRNGIGKRRDLQVLEAARSAARAIEGWEGE